MKNNRHRKRVLPLFEVDADENVVEKEEKVYCSKGAFFLESWEDYDGPKSFFETFSRVLCEKIDGGGSCIFCNIEFDKDNNTLIVGGKNERSPTTSTNQLELINKGLCLLIEPHPWHMINEIIVPMQHYRSMFDLNILMIENIMRTTLWRWGVYSKLMEKIEDKIPNFVEDKILWLGMTTNDRMGASISHLHTHLTLSIFKPKILIPKIKKDLISCVGKTQNFRINVSQGSNPEIIIISKNKFKPLDLMKVATEISIIKMDILKLLYKLFRFNVPLIEGMFLECTEPNIIIYDIAPFKNEGCLEKYRGKNFFSVSSEKVYKLIRNSIEELNLNIEPER